jgi:hypothetical protein
MNAITTIAEPPASSVVQSPVLADSLLNFVARAMADPNINVEKLEVLLRMQREIIIDEARLQFNEAMSAAQSEMVAVTRNAQNSQTSSRYATLEKIDAAIRPIYTRHGFALEFNSEPIEGSDIRIVCEVVRGRFSKFYRLDAPLDVVGPQGKLNKTPLHGLGSTVSYLRRYLKCMIFDVVLTNEDNDGNRQVIVTDGRMTIAQLAELNDMLIRTNTEEAKFLTHHKLECQTIQQVPAAEFVRLKNSLLSKQNVLAQRAAAARAAAARQPQNGDGQ